MRRQESQAIRSGSAAISLFYPAVYRVIDNRIGGFDLNAMQMVDMWKLWVK